MKSSLIWINLPYKKNINFAFLASVRRKSNQLLFPRLTRMFPHVSVALHNGVVGVNMKLQMVGDMLTAPSLAQATAVAMAFEKYGKTGRCVSVDRDIFTQHMVCASPSTNGGVKFQLRAIGLPLKGGRDTLRFRRRIDQSSTISRHRRYTQLIGAGAQSDRPALDNSTGGVIGWTIEELARTHVAKVQADRIGRPHSFEIGLRSVMLGACRQLGRSSHYDFAS